MHHISWLLWLSQQYVFSVFQDVVWEMSLVQCRYETEIFICGIYCGEGNTLFFKAGALKVNVRERERGSKTAWKRGAGLRDGGRGDKQESRRQLRLNYAEANFILMAETPPHSTGRNQTHARTWKEMLTWNINIHFVF